MHKLKNLKKIIQHYKWLSVVILVFVVVVPLFVLAQNTPETGYKAPKNSVSQPMFYVAEDGLGVEQVGFCVGNGSSNDYFIPTAKFSDTQAFFNHKPAGVNLVDCVGDGQCTGNEDCNNAPDDCGLCTSIVSVDPCSLSCTGSCPCSSYCTFNCSYSGGGGGGGGGGQSCTHAYDYGFYASC